MKKLQATIHGEGHRRVWLKVLWVWIYLPSGDYLEFEIILEDAVEREAQGEGEFEFIEKNCILDVMSGRPGAFHKKHGQHIRLLEEDTVAHRIDSYNKAVVFTDQPIPQGSMFQVKLLDKGGGWAGSIVSAKNFV